MSVPGSANPLLLRSAGGYSISRSLRFNSSDSAYLSRTPASAGNRKTFTVACWVKRSVLGTTQYIWEGGSPDGTTTRLALRFNSSDNINILNLGILRTTTQVFRDPSAWYHIVVAVDTTQATGADRIKLYVNGSQITSFSSSSDPTQNADTGWNMTASHSIGYTHIDSGNYGNFYLADFHNIDGQALTPTSFGEFSATTGVWVPKAYVASGPNNGTTWSSTLSATGGVTNASNAFNGDLSTAALSVTDNATLVFNTSSYNLSGTVRVFTPAIASGCVLRISANGGAYTETTSNSAQWTNLGNVGSISEIKVAINPANSADIKTPLAAIEVNGVVLINGNTSNIGTNGFKLSFSDNSTTAALGTDTSGNGNNWTPNNLSVGSTKSYTSDVTGTFAANRGAIKAFDGATSGSDFYAQPADGNTVTIGSLAITGITKLRMWLGKNNTGDPWGTLSLNGTSVTSFLTSNYPSLNATGQWIDLTSQLSGSTLSSITMTSPVANTDVRLAAVEVNDVVLIDKAAPIPAAGNDSLVDVPTNGSEVDTGSGGQVRGNYCTWNPLDKGSSVTLANGNLDFSQTATLGSSRGTIGVSSGKWYWEVSSPSNGSAIGIMKASANIADYVGGDANGWSYYANNGYKYNSNSGSSYGATFGSGDVIGVALDADNGTLTFYKNGTSQGQAYSGLTSGPYFPAFGNGSTSCSANFGQRPFAYPVSGFKALCTANLPAPLVTKPSTVMDVALYTGNGGTQTISGLGFSPDLVWIKNRTDAEVHGLFDVVRGADNWLSSNTTGAETNYGGGFGVTSFTSDGFVVGTGTAINANGKAIVAWNWDAGSSTVTNTQGSISSQVRANASAGFSIVTYTGTRTSAGNDTIGHGLGVAPSLVITKSRSNTSRWVVQHVSLGTDDYLELNTTAASADSSSVGAGALPKPTSSVFYASWLQGLNINAETFVAYCFAPVAGYVNAFSYTGTGGEGPMVYLGMRPRLVLIKRTDSTGSWFLFDAARSPYNETRKYLLAESSAAEGDDGDITNGWQLDFLSNGFKIRADAALQLNANGGTYVGFAWAESPFQYARAR